MGIDYLVTPEVLEWINHRKSSLQYGFNYINEGYREIIYIITILAAWFLIYQKKINVDESSFEEMAFGMLCKKQGMSLTTTTTTEKMNDDKQSLW